MDKFKELNDSDLKNIHGASNEGTWYNIFYGIGWVLRERGKYPYYYWA